MNEEEIKAIKGIEEMIELFEDDCLLTTEDDIKYLKVILNIIKKQQKEIEKLKSKKYIFNAETNEIKEIPISDDYISKDKIKEKIEELKNRKIGASTGIFAVQVDILEELLGE